MQELRDRYEAKIEQRGPDDCWPWTAATIKGYGYASQRRPVIRRGGKTVLASRLGWELRHGEVPAPRMCVLHSCDNSLCMNPGHWFLGTRAENTADMVAKGRHRPAPRKTNPDDENEIRALVRDGMSQSEAARRFGVTRIVVARVIGAEWATRQYRTGGNS